ncbi:MAG: hypothetical protein Tp185DCM00d2C31949971_6 [Prokaryotic dsDNA virus sp.]|nr:MAG: hypothetical protein Tp185DCM00d2C31949971_6 [Prokaryotic dsDNA virus sp.]QDP61775.1 MAG: hypothetical protein Tp1111MES1053591_14 [Prokaryotic dsDNA virus sp.]
MKMTNISEKKHQSNAGLVCVNGFKKTLRNKAMASPNTDRKLAVPVNETQDVNVVVQFKIKNCDFYEKRD